MKIAFTQNEFTLTLKANVLPVRTIARTVQSAANQPFINGLQDTHMNGLAVIHWAYETQKNTNMQRETLWLNKNTHVFYACYHDCTSIPHTETQTLTLCNGKDKIPLLQEFPVQPRRSKEKMCDCSQTGPANSWLDVFLQMEVGTKNRKRPSQIESESSIDKALKQIQK